MKKTILLSALIAGVNVASAATLNSMSKDQVTQEFSGKTLTTIPLSTIGTHLVADRVTINFNTDGKVTGRLAEKTGNMPQTDQGTWTVSDDGQLCITWDKWFNQKPFCDYVYDVKNSMLFISPEGEFVSLALKKEITPENKSMPMPDNTTAPMPDNKSM